MIKNFSIILLFAFTACKAKNKQQDQTVAVDSTAAVETKPMLQPEDVKADVSALLPAPNSYNLKDAKRWYDAAGENWLVMYETGSYGDKKTETASAKLSAALYIKKDTGFVSQWKMNDNITECPVDVVCEFYKNHLQITDLNKDGIAEVTMVYALACKGDISPNSKKLIMYEGNNKFAIRGDELVVMQKDSIGGTMQVDAAFSKAPAAFLAFAREHWKKFGFTRYN